MPKTIIFASGRLSSPEALRRRIAAGDTIVCADGGALNAIALGLVPHVVVGDMDSLPETTARDLAEAGTEIIRKPRNKDQTDLECAIRLSVERGARDIVIVTALGGRMDHMLANCLLLARPEWQPARLRLVEDEQEAWVLNGPDECVIDGAPGDTLSLLICSSRVDGVNMTGVEWAVANRSFEFGSTCPISNVLTERQALVSIESGACLAVHIPARART